MDTAAVLPSDPQRLARPNILKRNITRSVNRRAGGQGIIPQVIPEDEIEEEIGMDFSHGGVNVIEEEISSPIPKAFIQPVLRRRGTNPDSVYTEDITDVVIQRSSFEYSLEEDCFPPPSQTRKPNLPGVFRSSVFHPLSVESWIDISCANPSSIFEINQTKPVIARFKPVRNPENLLLPLQPYSVDLKASPGDISHDVSILTQLVTLLLGSAPEAMVQEMTHRMPENTVATAQPEPMSDDEYDDALWQAVDRVVDEATASKSRNSAGNIGPDTETVNLWMPSMSALQKFHLEVQPPFTFPCHTIASCADPSHTGTFNSGHHSSIAFEPKPAPGFGISASEMERGFVEVTDLDFEEEKHPTTGIDIESLIETYHQLPEFGGVSLGTPSSQIAGMSASYAHGVAVEDCDSEDNMMGCHLGENHAIPVNESPGIHSLPRDLSLAVCTLDDSGTLSMDNFVEHDQARIHDSMGMSQGDNDDEINWDIGCLVREEPEWESERTDATLLGPSGAVLTEIYGSPGQGVSSWSNSLMQVGHVWITCSVHLNSL